MLYCERGFEKEDDLCLASGRVASSGGRGTSSDLRPRSGAAAGQAGVPVPGQKITPTIAGKGNLQIWLPDSTSYRTIDIILPNTIHGSKKKNL